MMPWSQVFGFALIGAMSRNVEPRRAVELATEAANEAGERGICEKRPPKPE